MANFVFSCRNRGQDRCPTVKWSGIQNALEESQSDVLIILDCCASGMSNTDEGKHILKHLIQWSIALIISTGNGVTELLAACAFNSIANGVGPFSFTHALISQLRKLVHVPVFSIGYLYNLLFTEIQSWRLENSQHKKATIHLVLTQDHRLPRSITLSAKRPTLQPGFQPLGFLSNETRPSADGSISDGKRPASMQQSASSGTPSTSRGDISPFNSDGASSTTSGYPLPEYPRLLFSIRISEDIKPHELSSQLLADWLGTLPIAAKSIRVEAGFASDSTLLVVSMPAALLGYLPKDPAISILGTTRSTNLVAVELQERCEKFENRVLSLESANRRHEDERQTNEKHLQMKLHDSLRLLRLQEMNLESLISPSTTDELTHVFTIPDIKNESTLTYSAQDLKPELGLFTPRTEFESLRLLSPGLPDIVEEELLRLQQKSATRNTVERYEKARLPHTPRETPESAKVYHTPKTNYTESSSKLTTVPEKEVNKSLIVKIPYKKQNAIHIQHILALAQKPWFQMEKLEASEKPLPNSVEQRRKSELDNQRAVEAKFYPIGTMLKRKMDSHMSHKHRDSTAPIPDSERKVGLCIGVESLMAYMLAFHARDRVAQLRSNLRDSCTWDGFLKLQAFLEHATRHYTELHALIEQMGAVAREMLNRVLMDTLRITNKESMEKMLKETRENSRARDAAWMGVKRNEKVLKDLGVKLETIGPWSSVEDVVILAGNVLDVYCTKEKLEWSPDTQFVAAREASSWSNTET